MKCKAALHRKRPFILLEVMIALSLAILCAVPLMVKPIQMFRREIANLEEGELERLADWTFSEIKADLLNHKIGKEKLPKKGGTTAPFPMKTAQIQLPGMAAKEVGRSYTIYCKGEKEAAGGRIYKLYYVDVLLKEKKYCYRVML